MSKEIPTADDAFADEQPAAGPIEKNLKSRATWTRLLFMIISAVLLCVASLVCSVVVVLGFFWVLFTGEVNRQVQEVGQSIAAYVYSIVRYLTFNTDEKPFPLGGEWSSVAKD